MMFSLSRTPSFLTICPKLMLPLARNHACTNDIHISPKSFSYMINAIYLPSLRLQKEAVISLNLQCFSTTLIQ